MQTLSFSQRRGLKVKQKLHSGKKPFQAFWQLKSEFELLIKYKIEKPEFISKDPKLN